MINSYSAVIKYDTDSKHPDVPNAKNLKFNDVYRINTYMFGGNINSFIKNDLKLVAGGGYDTKHIKNVKITIEEINNG